MMKSLRGLQKLKILRYNFLTFIHATFVHVAHVCSRLSIRLVTFHDPYNCKDIGKKSEKCRNKSIGVYSKMNSFSFLHGPFLPRNTELINDSSSLKTPHRFSDGGISFFSNHPPHANWTISWQGSAVSSSFPRMSPADIVKESFSYRYSYFEW